MKYFSTRIDGVRLRKTTEDDTVVILNLIKEIAEYEKMLNEVVATEESIRTSIFEKNEAEVLLVEYNEDIIGYVLYFFNYSTFIGKAGFYLEDIYIKPEYRGRGIGKDIFRIIAGIAYENKCERMEWTCLNWNEPSIKFYKGLGAVPMSEWTVYRLAGDKIKNLANK